MQDCNEGVVGKANDNHATSYEINRGTHESESLIAVFEWLSHECWIQRVYKIDQTTKIHDDKPCKPIEGSLVYTTFISVSPLVIIQNCCGFAFCKIAE